jgi:ABC-type Fe3+-hydroxamate transport system substrate-binding protein
MAGYRNAVEEPITGPPVLSLERLLQLSPDAIVVLSALPVTEHERAQWIEQWSVFSTLDAVKAEKIAVLGGAQTLSTGPQVLTLPERLREALRFMGVDGS